ncbi:MAG: hypothetical protein FJ148_13915 [Deltaproteobacteria bacterium]|nr:hypothetical protein [Deltaproteobacteria bacterium]
MLGYRFAMLDVALRICHERCPPVEVTLEPWQFVVSVADRRAVFGLCEMDRLADHVCAELERERRAGVKRLPLWLVGGHLLALRENGLGRANPAVAEVLRAVLAVTRHAPGLAGRRALYQEPYVVRDVVRHRAAAIALAFLDAHLLDGWMRTRGEDPDTPYDDDVRVAALHDWRALFSPDARTYRSLDRTLMNLPAGVPAEPVWLLSRARLERPLLGRFALTALLLLLGDRRYGRHPDASAGHATILQRACEADVVEACALLGAHARRALDPRRARDLQFLVAFLLDYPARFRGTLPGLVHRAIRWHAQRARLEARVAARPDPDTAVAAVGRPASVAVKPRRRPGEPQLPSIPLPSIPGITFLATVDAIEAEGARMGHCISDYVDEAVRGDCYLFHVAHESSEASVEVDRCGYVRQASGPCNVENAASRWGRRQLRDWGRKLRADEPEEPVVAGPAPAVWARLQRQRDARVDRARQLTLWR